MTKKDPVNHPEHYETNGIECIDAMVASQGKDAVKEFCVCNAFKYIWRNKHKKSSVEDIKKAVWYLEKFLQLSDDKDYIRVGAPKKEHKPSWDDVTHEDCVKACLALEDAMDVRIYYFIPFRGSDDDLIIFTNYAGDTVLKVHMRQYDFDFSKMLVDLGFVDKKDIHKCANRKDE